MSTMSTHRAFLPLALLAALALSPLTGGCDSEGATTPAADAGGSDLAGSDATGADAAESDAPATATTGTVHVTGSYQGTLAGSPNLRVSMFPCPFQMPPKYYFEGTYDAASGAVEATQEDVEPGEWCLMAYIDVNPDDGLAPVVGLDPQNAGNGENANGAVPVTVTAGQTTEVALSFALATVANQ